MRYGSIFDLVGNTPTIRIGAYKDATLWAKLEGHNPTGSLKDRTASAIVQHAFSVHNSDKTLLDASSGSFACALAYYGRLVGMNVTVVANSKISPDNVAFLRSQNANIIQYGTVTGESRNHCLEAVGRDPERWFFTDQLTNPLAPTIHERTTAREIFQDVPNVKAIVASKGSGATLCGLCRYVAHSGASVRIFGSVGYPDDTKKIAGTYVEEADFVSPFIEELSSNEVYSGDQPVWYEDAVSHCLSLPILVGPQGGGVYKATLDAIDKHHIAGDVVMIMGDTMLKNASRF